MSPSTSIVGLAVGLVLGLAWAFEGFDAFLLVAVLGALGFAIGKVIDGELDLSPVLSAASRGRGGS